MLSDEACVFSLSAFGEIGESIRFAAHTRSIMYAFFRHRKDVVENVTVGNCFLFKKRTNAYLNIMCFDLCHAFVVTY